MSNEEVTDGEISQATFNSRVAWTLLEFYGVLSAQTDALIAASPVIVDRLTAPGESQAFLHEMHKAINALESAQKSLDFVAKACVQLEKQGNE